MLVSDFVVVPAAVEETARRLVAQTGRLADHAVSAGDDVGELDIVVGPELAGRRIVGRRVRVELSGPRVHGDRQVISLRWHAVGPGASLLPAMEADLELAPAGPGSTQIQLYGTYTPPLEAAGRRLDRLLLHRVAQSTVRAFLHHLAQDLSSPAVQPGA